MEESKARMLAFKANAFFLREFAKQRHRAEATKSRMRDDHFQRFAIHLYEVLKVFAETSPRARLFFRRFAFFANLVIQYLSLSRHAQCINRGIVQSVERQSPKLNVEGSSPSAPVKRRRSVCQIFFFFAHLPG